MLSQGGYPWSLHRLSRFSLGIDANLAVVEGKTAQQWPMKAQIIGWRSALRRVQPFLTDEIRKKQVEQMILAIDEYVGMNC